MRPTRREVLCTVAIAGLAGCAGDGGGGGDDPTDTDTQTATDSDGAATVRVRSHGELGELLVGPEEMTLYMFDQDTRGDSASTCYDGCASTWPPLTVEGSAAAGDGVTAEVTTFERDDGATQVAANGWPLYYYAPDGEPGDANGQGVGDIWWVLDPDGVPRKPSETTTEAATETATNSSGY